MKGLVNFAMAGIEPIIPGHLVMLFRYVLYQKLDEVQYGDGFLDIGIVFVFIVVEGDIIPIIRINARGGDNRAAKIAPNVFDDRLRVTKIRFCIDVKSILIFFINVGFDFFKRRADPFFQSVEENGLERCSEISVVKISNPAPKPIVGKATFGQEAVDMRVPFKRAAESMKDADKTRDKVFLFIKLMEHFQDDATDCLK